MKTYILRDPKTVEPQKIQFAPAPSPAAPRAAYASTANSLVLFIGLDVARNSYDERAAHLGLDLFVQALEL